MLNEREHLLNELIEHTIDCDCARNQHFYDEKECRKKARMFNKIQSVVFLCTIATYVLIVSGIKQEMWLNILGIVLTLFSTMLEILSYMLRYDEEAMSHWKAAQMYSELYRKCQFFCSDYVNASLDVWREKLRDISEELSRISSLSPSVSDESFDDWEKWGYEKKYPVYRVVKDMKVVDIKEVLETIIRELKECKIEIYLFGSYFTNMHYNDIDIAVILHQKETSIPLKERMNAIEKAYAIQGLDLDITIISEDDIIANRCTQFIKNICDGECYYKSPEVKKSIVEEYTKTLSNYTEMVTYFMNQAENTKDNFRVFTSNVFYMYYHLLAGLLSDLEINWYGERSMIIECEYLATSEEKMMKLGVDSKAFEHLIQHARLFMDEKNTAYLNSSIKDDIRDTLIQYYETDKNAVNQILGYINNNQIS